MNSKGSKAFGYCDRSGFRYPLKDLVYEVRDGVRTGFRVGRDIADPDHPQNFLGRLKIFDPQSLRDPRPENKSESYTVKYPVFDSATLEPLGTPDALITQTGTVTVTIS